MVKWTIASIVKRKELTPFVLPKAPENNFEAYEKDEKTV